MLNIYLVPDVTKFAVYLQWILPKQKDGVHLRLLQNKHIETDNTGTTPFHSRNYHIIYKS